MRKYTKLEKYPRVLTPVGTFFPIEDDINITLRLQQHKAVIRHSLKCIQIGQNSNAPKSRVLNGDNEGVSRHPGPGWYLRCRCVNFANWVRTFYFPQYSDADGNSISKWVRFKRGSDE
jgi:hypothetical protein